MPITFRHDAAGVVPPSNQTTRKYGQQLVLQQNQQKYAAQQQNYDRAFALERDAMQSKNQAIMQGQQNAARAIANATQFANDQTLQESQDKFRQQQAEAEQQAKFMEDARKQSSGMIMDDIKNENYDPATARKLQQNLVAESEALGNPQLDATQRAEALAKIRAERAMLTASRMEKPPKPTAQEQFDQGIVTGPDGTQYRQNSKGDFDPLEQQQKPPRSANEAFQADPKMRKQYVDEATKELTDPETGKLPDREKANARAMELYDIDQKSFNPQPTAAPAMPGEDLFGSPQTSMDLRPEQSILEQAPSGTPANPGQPPETQQVTESTPTPAGMQKVWDGTRYYFREADAVGDADMSRQRAEAMAKLRTPTSVPELPGSQPATQGAERSILEQAPPPSGQQAGLEATYDADMQSKGYMLVTPEDGSRPYYYKVDSAPQSTADMAAAQQPAGQSATPTQAPTPNPWSEVATGKPREPMPLTSNASSANPSQMPSAKEPGQPTQPVKAQAPNFTSMIAGTKDVEERRVLGALQGMYAGQPPEVQNAIGVILNDQSSLAELKSANDYLRSAGIDIDQLAKYQHRGGGRKGKNK